jgi:hypothetical protein
MLRVRAFSIAARFMRDMLSETSLGLTLMILVTIAGNEISHLVGPIAALLVMAAACASGAVAYEWGT